MKKRSAKKTRVPITGCVMCDAKIGQLHEPNCPWEQCPFCKGQLLGCTCWMKRFGITEEDPRELTKKEEDQWEEILKANGIPFGQETGDGRSPLLD